MIIDDLAEPLEHLTNSLAIGARVLGDIVLRQFDQVTFWGEDRRHIFDPRHVLADSGVGDLELLGLWMEGDADADRFVILGQDLSSEQTRHEGCDALLTIDQYPLAQGRRSVLQLHGWIAPRDQIADGIPLIERIRSEEHTSELQSPCNLVC